MTTFKTWLEQIDQTDPMGDKPQSLRPQAEEKLQELWRQTFQLLNISGLDKADTIKNTLEDITKDAPGKSSSAVVLNRLKQVMKDLGNLGLRNEVEAARNYLKGDSEGVSQKNVGELLKAMFGQQFDKLYGGEDRASDTDGALTGMDGGTPPVDNVSRGTDQIPDAPAPPAQMMAPDPNDPNATPGQQPQVPPVGSHVAPPTQNPNQPPPPGVFMGMY